MKDDEKKKYIAALKKRKRVLEIKTSINPERPDLSPSPKQEAIFEGINKHRYRYVRSGNQSGKTQMALREIAWLVEDCSPYLLDRPEWKNKPLMILIAVQDRKNAKVNIWPRLKSLLSELDGVKNTASIWREEKDGGALQFVEHKTKGHKIIFFPHGKGDEDTFRSLQGYTAHYVMCDEMPKDYRIFTELRERVTTNKGYFIATFTPTVVNMNIKRAIDRIEEIQDRADSIQCVYRISKLDNPIHDAAKVMAEYMDLPVDVRNTKLYGDWTAGDQAVYAFNLEKMVAPLPSHYAAMSWRHVFVIDPATSSRSGFSVWGQDPNTGCWWGVESGYFEGSDTLVADKLLDLALEKARPYYVVFWICDSEPWFWTVAQKRGMVFHRPSGKTRPGMKETLIKNLQSELSSGIIKFADKNNELVIDEIGSCQWNANRTGIVNAQTYHILDTCQYFVYLKPKDSKDDVPLTYWETVRNDAKKTRSSLIVAKPSALRKSRHFRRRG